jgi:dipeptidyl aminopeptidase/acylaminoacyl peptidase
MHKQWHRGVVLANLGRVWEGKSNDFGTSNVFEQHKKSYGTSFFTFRETRRSSRHFEAPASFATPLPFVPTPRLHTPHADGTEEEMSGNVPAWKMEKELRVGHAEGVTRCAWSPDGTRLASVSSEDEKGVRVWDVHTGRQVTQLSWEGGYSYWCVWSPDGKQLAASMTDCCVVLWNVEEGSREFFRKKVAILGECEGGTTEGHSRDVYCCAWSPDGARIASSGDNKVLVWDVHNAFAWTYDVGRQVVATLAGHGGTVTSCEWSPDGGGGVHALFHPLVQPSSLSCFIYCLCIPTVK